MIEVKTIKGIDEETWREFKSLAAKDNVNLGVFLKNMIKGYKKTSNDFWKNILKGEKILSDNEAKDIESSIKLKRKEYGFRL